MLAISKNGKIVNFLGHAELVSASDLTPMLKQVQHDKTKIQISENDYSDRFFELFETSLMKDEFIERTVKHIQNEEHYEAIKCHQKAIDYLLTLENLKEK